MDSDKQSFLYRIQNGFDLRTLTSDLKMHMWTVILLSVAVSMFMFVRYSSSYRPRYTVSATYVVTTRSASNNMISNLTTAQQTANVISSILTSRPLMDAVAADLGTASVPGSISCNIVQETNLLDLSVTASSPRTAFLILDSVMRNYPVVTNLLNRDVVMQILVPPEVPTAPNNPNRPTIRTLKVFVLCFAVLTALFSLLSVLKDTIRRGSDIENKLEEKYLGSIAHEEKYKTFRMWLRGGHTTMLIDQPVCSFRYIESVQKVCRAVQSQMEKRGHKSLLVVSYAENEGKSTVAANLALALAQRGKRTLLMDLDLRDPSQYKVFDFTDDPLTALGDLLTGKTPTQPLIEQMEAEGLFYIFSTKSYSHSTEILTNGRLEQLLKYLRGQFDYIVIDTPPVSLTADVEPLADMADAYMLVIREHRIWARQIRDMLDTLSGYRASSIGCIINDSHNPLSSGGGYGYGSDYGGGYGYGRYYGRYYGSYYGNYGKKAERNRKT